jgi:uncharacterized protein (TIGR02145 family)
MKTKIIFVTFLILNCTMLNAQTITMNIHKTDGSILSIPTNNVDSITYKITNLNPYLTYGIMSDQDGNSYATIVIGSQEWMAENLRTTTYFNGDTIPNIPLSSTWGLGAWEHYNNDNLYENPYGKLYNWFAVTDSRKLCPTGWHIPTDAEWTTLTNYLGGNIAGGKMKSTGTQYWTLPNVDATNASGFTGLPAGKKINTYLEIGESALWWSSTPYYTSTINNGWYRSLSYSNGDIIRNHTTQHNGLSVRCIKD